MEKVKTIVLLHGWGKSGESMQPLASLFRERGYTTYTPDFPGFGNEKTPEKPWNLDEYVEWLKKYLDTNRLKHFILFAHSFGGRVAIKLVTKYPELVETLTLCGAPGIKSRLSWKRWMLWKAVGICKWWVKGATWDAFVPWPIRGFLERRLSRLDYFKVSGIMRETFKNVVKEDLRPYLKKIDTPTLLIWGEHDSFVPLRDAQIIHKEISNSKLIIIPRTGHNVYRIHANLVAQHIFQFLT